MESVVLINGTTTITTMMMQVADSFLATAEASDYESWGLLVSGTVRTGAGTSSGTPSSSSGLSVAAQAGIGVGVGVCAIALILAILIFRRRRRSMKEAHPETDNAFVKAELPGVGLPRPEKDGTEGLQEADTVSKPPEADASNVVAELETDWTGWEAPALLEIELSRDAADAERLASNQPQQRSMMRNNIQETPVESTGGS
jgi:hypothetical protein